MSTDKTMKTNKAPNKQAFGSTYSKTLNPKAKSVSDTLISGFESLPQYFELTKKHPMKTPTKLKPKTVLKKNTKFTNQPIIKSSPRNRHRQASDSVVPEKMKTREIQRVTFAPLDPYKHPNFIHNESLPQNHDHSVKSLRGGSIIYNHNLSGNFNSESYFYWLNRISVNGMELGFSPNYIRSDFRVVRIAVSNDWNSYQFASSSLKLNPEILALALKQNLQVLQFVPHKGTDSVFFKAVRDDWRALRYAPSSITSDTQLICEAIHQSYHAINFAADELKNDRIFMLHAVSIDGRCLKYAADAIKDCKLIAIEAVNQRGSAIKYVSAKLQRDSDVLSAAFSDEEDDISVTSNISAYSFSQQHHNIKTSEIHEEERNNIPDKSVNHIPFSTDLYWQVKCLKGHALISFQAPWDGWCCDECGQYLPLGEARQRFTQGARLFGCRQCNYDICESCFKYLSTTPIRSRNNDQSSFGEVEQLSVKSYPSPQRRSRLFHHQDHHRAYKAVGSTHSRRSTSPASSITRSERSYTSSHSSSPSSSTPQHLSDHDDLEPETSPRPSSIASHESPSLSHSLADDAYLLRTKHHSLWKGKASYSFYDKFNDHHPSFFKNAFPGYPLSPPPPSPPLHDMESNRRSSPRPASPPYITPLSSFTTPIHHHLGRDAESYSRSTTAMRRLFNDDDDVRRRNDEKGFTKWKEKQENSQREDLKHRCIKDSELATLYDTLNKMNSVSSLRRRNSSIHQLNSSNYLYVSQDQAKKYKDRYLITRGNGDANSNHQQTKYFFKKKKMISSKHGLESRLTPPRRSRSLNYSDDVSRNKIYEYSRNNVDKRKVRQMRGLRDQFSQWISSNTLR